MATHLSRTRPVADAWTGISDEQNDAQTTAIFGVIERNGGAVKALGFSPASTDLVAVIDYPDESSAQRAIAEILALGTLEFVSIEPLWDVMEWTATVRAAAQRA